MDETHNIGDMLIGSNWPKLTNNIFTPLQRRLKDQEAKVGIEPKIPNHCNDASNFGNVLILPAETIIGTKVTLVSHGHRDATKNHAIPPTA